MLCRNPQSVRGSIYPCGRCSPCLKTRRKLWTHRIHLEALQHPCNTFVTLTYSQEHLPKGGSLAPEETRDWLKRFRAAVAPRKIRYYLVGEYGDASWRPHYHVAIFNYPNCKYGLSRYTRERKECCEACDRVRDTWGLGNVYLGALEVKSARYIAGYITKKMTRFDDPRLPRHLHPEFARMSLKPGIGVGHMWDVADAVITSGYHHLQGDVPSSLQHGKTIYPLGRYLRQKLRERIGKEPSAPEHVQAKTQQDLMQIVQDHTGIDPKTVPHIIRAQFIKNALVEASHQKVLNAETRAEIFKSRKVL